MAGYHERKQLGFGTFIDDSLLRTREHSALSDVLRRVPGLTLTYLPSGGGLAVQMSRAGTISTCPIMAPQCGAPGGLANKERKDTRCFAQIYLDGIRVYAPGQNTGDSRGFSIDQFMVLHLQAIEIYKGPGSTPAQYNSTGSACGTVLLWTRDR
jgi:outer membrane receptor for monomeric catechols